MINFEIRYDEGSAKWQFRAPSGQWSEAMPLAKLGETLHSEVKSPPEREQRWSKPIDHRGKGNARVAEAQRLWEVRGGKVQRIASSAAERQAEAVSAILALWDEEDKEEAGQ